VDWRQLGEQVVGEQVLLETPYGRKPLVYADYTASGRAYAPIEQFIQQRVLPFYANTHSESSLTGRQSNRLREQARDCIRKALNAGPEHAVIFCGTGATAAINKLVDLLQLRRTLQQPVVVFIGPYEHHSNELPWRESEAEVVVIPLDEQGELDLKVLEQQLQNYQGQARLLASFSAASNVTGLKTDTARVGELVHRYGGSIFWDYAAAAPYMAIDVQDMDAVFISPHKFLGGPGTPGLLVVRKELATNPVPAVPGGGTVSFVAPDFHHYLQDCEHREEGGTPGIVESVRAGLVFQLQQQVGTDVIEAREQELVQSVLERWSRHPGIRILGNPDLPRLSIVSLQVWHGEEQLHYAFVVALLNDLFGIQARGGCSCAGPYGHSLLSIDAEESRALDAQVSRGNSVLRPGWVRLNFNYFLDDASLEYLQRALELVAEHGWKLLPDYHYQPDSGTWVHRDAVTDLPVSLEQFDPTTMDGIELPCCQVPLAQYLEQAEALLLNAVPDQSAQVIELDDQAEALRWFYLPKTGRLEKSILR
jgi:selenocysteine lyase/cysteine desulfurase